MYNSIKDFRDCCSLFTDVEKEEIIKEGIDIGNVIEYINYEVDTVKAINRQFNSQKTLVYDIEY